MMMKKCTVVLLLAFVSGCGGYRLQQADIATLENLPQNCAENVELLAEAGAKFAQERATDRTCVCGIRAVLARAGQPLPDAGRLGCPQ